MEVSTVSVIRNQCSFLRMVVFSIDFPDPDVIQIDRNLILAHVHHDCTGIEIMPAANVETSFHSRPFRFWADAETIQFRIIRILPVLFFRFRNGVISETTEIDHDVYFDRLAVGTLSDA